MSFTDLRSRFLGLLQRHFVDDPERLTSLRDQTGRATDALALQRIARDTGGHFGAQAEVMVMRFLDDRKKIRLRAHPSTTPRKARAKRTPPQSSTAGPQAQTPPPPPPPAATDYSGLEESVRKMGARARAAGRALTANPFPTTVPAHAWWTAGWKAATDPSELR